MAMLNKNKWRPASVLFSALFLILGILPGNLSGQPVFEDKQRLTVVANHIETITTWDHNYAKNRFDRVGHKTSYTRFDRKGNVVESVTYRQKDTLAHELFRYDHEGKRTDYTKRRGVTVAYQKSSQYDVKGNLLLEKGFDGSAEFSNEYKYDEQDRLTHIIYTLDNKPKEKRIFVNTGSQTEITVNNAQNQIISYLTLRFDDNRNLLEELIYGPDKTLLERKLFVYNADKQAISEVKYRGEAFSYKLTFLYNHRGDLVSIDEENPNEGRYQKKSYNYDTVGNLIEMRWRRNGREKFSERTYTYDAKNNCTQFETFYPATNFRVLTKMAYD